MRALNSEELRFVSGGDGERDEPTEMIQNGLEACEGYSDDHTVTMSITNTSSLGIGSFGSSSETITFEMTCGEVREAAESQTGSDAGGG